MKVIFMTILMCLISSFVMADVIVIPKECKEIKSSTFSSGGGNKAIVYVKIHCKMNDGKDKLFLAKKVSASGIFGVGRWTIPDMIEFKRTNIKDKAEWE